LVFQLEVIRVGCSPVGIQCRSNLPVVHFNLLLIAIAKARGWIDDIRLGRIGSFAEIAEREGQGERHIRLLAPLAFLSPRIIAAIVDGTAPADLTVTGLAKALPYSWIEQEQRVGL
jgi:site-specific DNA recombinase